MRLLLDVGNTRMKWRLLAGEVLVDQGAVANAAFDAAVWTRLPAPSRVHGVSVVGQDRQAAIEQHCFRLWALPVHWLVVNDSCCGVRNLYQSPTLGADRWAAVIAAHAWRGNALQGPVLAINAGTAITIDVLAASGDYLGGSILPGLQLMRAALAGSTARLPLAAGQVQQIPRTTDDAIATGIIDAACGAIERMRSRIEGPVQLLLSGGDADVLISHLPAPVLKVENLVLDGLQVITR